MHLASITLWQAWGQWIAGRHVSDSEILWGSSLLFWARFGKIAQLAGALTIVLDIIGPEKLRGVGERMHELIHVKALAHLWQRMAAAVWTFLLWLFLDAANPRRKQVEAKLEEAWWFAMAFSLSYLPLMVFLEYHYARVYWNSGLLRFILKAIGLLFVSSAGYGIVFPVMVTLCGSMTLVIATLVDLVLLKPAAWLLEKPNLSWLAKVFAFVSLLIGFHFDLLSS